MTYKEIENQITEDTTFNFQIAVEDVRRLDINELNELYDEAPFGEYGRNNGFSTGIFADQLILMAPAKVFIYKDWWTRMKDYLEVDVDEATDTWTIVYLDI